MQAWPEAIVPATQRVGLSHRVRGLSLTALFFDVPLDHWEPQEGESISVHARLVVAADKSEKAVHELPFLVFLQGGPGFEAPRPTELSGWIGAAVASFRVLLVDQRGTGLSSRISAASLSRLGDSRRQADYCAHFRADSIIADCESIRQALGVVKWSVLGQSFGGFCTCTYLSFAPAGLQEAVLTGGLPPKPQLSAPASADEVYGKTFARAAAASARFYERFPGDEALVRCVVMYLASRPDGGVDLPTGGRLTPRGLQLLGWAFGGVGGFESVHYLLENAFDGDDLSLAFKRGFEAQFAWDSNPLYALLHEACYAHGGVTAWSAQRVRDTPQFAARFDAARCAAAGEPVLFTGEMVFPWIFEEVASLRPIASAAHALAARNWRASLYAAHGLAANNVPCAASIYFEDTYVDFDLSLETAKGIRGLRTLVTSEFLHSGVREDGPRLLKSLLALARGEEPVR